MSIKHKSASLAPIAIGVGAVAIGGALAYSSVVKPIQQLIATTVERVKQMAKDAKEAAGETVKEIGGWYTFYNAPVLDIPLAVAFEASLIVFSNLKNKPFAQVLSGTLTPSAYTTAKSWVIPFEVGASVLRVLGGVNIQNIAILGATAVATRSFANAYIDSGMEALAAVVDKYVLEKGYLYLYPGEVRTSQAEIAKDFKVFWDAIGPAFEQYAKALPDYAGAQIASIDQKLAELNAVVSSRAPTTMNIYSSFARMRQAFATYGGRGGEDALIRTIKEMYEQKAHKELEEFNLEYRDWRDPSDSGFFQQLSASVAVLKAKAFSAKHRSSTRMTVFVAAEMIIGVSVAVAGGTLLWLWNKYQSKVTDEDLKKAGEEPLGPMERTQNGTDTITIRHTTHL